MIGQEADVRDILGGPCGRALHRQQCARVDGGDGEVREFRPRVIPGRGGHVGFRGIVQPMLIEVELLGDRLRGAVCLDGFSGTGSIGLEALSRGAAKCVFVDEYQPSVKVILQNVAKCGAEE